MRTIILAVSLTVTILTPSFAQISPVQTHIETRIPPQALGHALKQFAEIRHMQVLFLAADVSGLRTPGASGDLTADEALTHLLGGTGLRYQYVGPGAVSIITGAQGTGKSQGGNTKKTKRHTLGVVSARINPKPSPDAVPNAPDPPAADQPYQRKQSTRTLEEIIVTAEKYRQRAFEVPSTVDVISGQTILEQGITDLSTLQFAVPGLYMNSTGYTHSVYLRGVGNTNGNDAMVGEYIDEADITAEGANGAQGYATGDNGLYDLARVEILKGPQGTLYGDGSMGGVIRYITNRPHLDRFEMTADVAALFTEYGAPGQRIETMLNTPLVSGTLGLRFAGMFEHDGGWVDAPAADQKNINENNVTDVRIEALWKPTEHFNVNAMQIIHRGTSGLGMGEDTNGNITPLFGLALLPNSTESSNLTNITLTYDMPGAQLLSSSTYSHENQNVHNLYITLPAGPSTYWLYIPQFADSSVNYTEELRLASSGGGRWNWMIGGFYRDFSYQDGQDYYFGASESSLDSAFHITQPLARGLSNSRAAFTNVSYDFFPRLTIGAGVRYSQDHERLVSAVFPFSAARFVSTEPRYYVRYGATGDVNVYASASKGFRSGGFNTPPTPPYQPEDLWTYEVGAKLRVPAMGLRVNVAPFLSNYSNLVQPSAIPPYPSANIGKARIKGADVDMTWQPTAGWRFALNAEILHSEMLAVSSISGYKVGDRVPYAPEYSLTASVERDFRWRDRPAAAQIYYYEISRVQTTTVGMAVYQSDIIRLLNARTTLNWSEHLQLGLFVHNLLNDRGLQSPDAAVGESVRPRPRTFGIEFNLRGL